MARGWLQDMVSHACLGKLCGSGGIMKAKSVQRILRLGSGILPVVRARCKQRKHGLETEAGHT